MKVEYDPIRDLLYIQFTESLRKVARTVTVVPGVHADFSSDDKLIGIEVLDAAEMVSRKVEFSLPQISQSVSLAHLSK